jgi:hypothetical protein
MFCVQSCVRAVTAASARIEFYSCAVSCAGSVGSAKNVNALIERGVTHVLNASPVVPCFHKKRLRYKVLEVYDDVDEDISQFFEESNQFIDTVRCLCPSCQVA